MQTVLITYDIAHPKRLRLAEKIVSNFALRLQDSVFRATLSDEQLAKCRLELSEVIDPSQDTVRYYPICGVDLAACILYQPETSECGTGWLL